jgi:hypothetical protein
LYKMARQDYRDYRRAVAHALVTGASSECANDDVRDFAAWSAEQLERADGPVDDPQEFFTNN